MFHETLLMNSVGFGSLVSVFGMEWNGLYSANIDSASGMGRGLSEPSPAQGGGGVHPHRVFREYLANRSADRHETWYT